ncbi:MAG: AMP-binding protein, partial [Bacilli bacterium]
MKDWYCTAIEKYQNATLLNSEEKSYTFGQFHKEMCEIREGFLLQGVKKGDISAMYMKNAPEFLLALVALWSIGVEVALLNRRLSKVEAVQQLREVDAKWILTDSKVFEEMTSLELKRMRPTSAFRWDNAPNNCATYMFTSGTTGQPKAAVQTFANHLASAYVSQKHAPLQTHHNWFVCLPLFHVGGLSTFFKTFVWGNQMTLDNRWDALTVFENIQSGCISHLSVVGTMLRELIDCYEAQEICCHPHMVSILVGGESVSQAELLRGKKYKLPLMTTYGMTETCSQIITNASITTSGSCGRPLDGVEVKLMQKGVEADEGELYVRGDMVIKRYAKNKGSNSFQNGWFQTGDWLRRDGEGYFYVLDRRSDMYISGGENVYPKEVEKICISLFPMIREAAVSSVAHRKWGEVGVLFYQSESTLDGEEIKQ